MIKIFTLFLFCATFVVAQNITLVPNITTAPKSNATVDAPIVQQDNSTTIEQASLACVPGISLGYLLIRQPNMSSIVTVGNSMNVSWDWSVSVKKIPQYVDVYIQLIAPGFPVTWKQQLIKQQAVNPRWFIFKVQGLADGKYKIRLVPDGKETYNVRADALPCFADGEAIPSVSSSFSVANSAGEIGNYPDLFPPNSVDKLSIGLHVIVLVVLVIIFNFT